MIVMNDRLPGYAGQILRVDLDSHRCTKSRTRPEVAKKYLGGKGLGTYLLTSECVPLTNPLDPGSRFIIATGPATGTSLPTASRYGVFFKSPLTGIYAESYSGGKVAPHIRWAGYDAIIVQGRAAKPVYLLVDADRVELRRADHLWGRETYETEDVIKEECGSPEFEVACIGPAGERLVAFSCLVNDYWRCAGRSGAGAVMGSKNLKAIAVRGDRNNINIADEERLRALSRELVKRLRNDRLTAEVFPKFGTPVMVNINNLAGAFPTRYWHEAHYDEYEMINAERLREKILVRSKACWGCPIACGKYCEVKDGKYAGVKVEGPEYETIYAFGGLCQINSIEAIAKLNDFCDRQGIDTITAGNVVAFAIEAFERGKLRPEFKLSYSDPDSALRLLGIICRREGVGRLLAGGVRSASKAMNLEDLAIHVKGLEPPGYDPRALKGMALSYGTSTRGACHLRSSIYAAELGGSMNPLSTDTEKVRLVKEWEDKFTIMDSLILCRFARNAYDWNILAELTTLLTGIEYTDRMLASIAEDIVNLTRTFNVREGISRKDDYLPKRLMTEPIPSGPSRGALVEKSSFDQMLDEYYRLRRWDPDGRPIARAETKPIE